MAGRRPRLGGKEDLKGAPERGSQEVSKEPQDPTTNYVDPTRVWCWEVTRRRDESVVHHQRANCEHSLVRQRQEEDTHLIYIIELLTLSRRDSTACPRSWSLFSYRQLEMTKEKRKLRLNRRYAAYCVRNCGQKAMHGSTGRVCLRNDALTWKRVEYLANPA